MVIEHPLIHGGGTQIPNRVIVHSMGEYVGGIHAPDFLYAYELSAHALVTPDGDIIRCRDDDKMAWHAKGHNTNTLGIEFLVPGDHTYSSFLKAIKQPYASEEQMLAGARWIAEWCARWDITVMQRHSDVDPARKLDPGEGFNFDRLKDLVWRTG